VPRTPEELDKLRRIVQNALGIDPASPDANELVALEEMTFSDPFGMVAEDMNSQANRQFWVNQVQTFLYPGLAVALFGVFFLLLKRTAANQLAPSIPSSRAAGRASAGGSLGGDGDIPVAYPGRDTHGQPAVMSVDVFNQLVRDNPDNMAHAIQSWLGKGKKQ
jgi:flagellar biosynthesis/type III secretory pathway M-ring protein FliF/YscJ